MEAPCKCNKQQKTSQEILTIAFVIVLFWIGIWGLFDTLLQQFIKGSVWNAVGIYGGLVAIVFLIVQARPQFLEHFI